MALLEVEHLSHEFVDKLLYKDSSFELYKGEHMGIVRSKWNRKKYIN
jgi:ABC-type phosphonate transport system ATPase subunit